MDKKQDLAGGTVTLTLMPTTEETYWGLLITGCGAIAAQSGLFADDAQARVWARKAPLALCTHPNPEPRCLRAGPVRRELGAGAVFRLAGLSSELDHGLFGLGMVLQRLMLCGCADCARARKVAHTMLAPSRPPTPPPPDPKGRQG